MLLTHHTHKAGLTPLSPSDWQTAELLSVKKQNQFVFQSLFDSMTQGLGMKQENSWQDAHVHSYSYR